MSDCLLIFVFRKDLIIIMETLKLIFNTCGPMPINLIFTLALVLITGVFSVITLRRNNDD